MLLLSNANINLDSETLVVAFTGISHQLGGIHFDFFKSLSELNCSSLFASDKACRWYQYDENELKALGKKILEAKKLSGAKRLSFLGNSMGGFGALLMSHFVETDHVLVFSPQTVISPSITASFNDNRWLDLRQTIPTYYYSDLSLLPAPSGKRQIVVGSQDLRDRQHAEYLARTWPCLITRVPNCGHNVAAKLREKGKLNAMLLEVLLGV